MYPKLFEGSNHSLYASIGNKIYGWDGNDWHEILSQNISQPPEIFDDAVIFRLIPSYPFDNPENLWIWKKDQAPPELALRDKPKPHPGIVTSQFRKPDVQTSHPLWKSLEDEYLTDAGAMFFKSDIYFFVDHSGTDKSGYDAKLVCLTRIFDDPVIVPLKFDTRLGQPPLKQSADAPWLGGPTPPWLYGYIWMFFTNDTLYIGQPNLPGIWAIPISEVESAVAAQKQIQTAKRTQLAAATEKAQNALLSKYDLNHNGIIDPDEKEAALDDPAFIESEMDMIDTNHDGWLDAAELVYFDANKNKILEPKEQAGIEIAQHLFAERLLKNFDANGDGWLDQSEFDDLVQASMDVGTQSRPSFLFPFPDANHDGHIDLGELESFLNQQMRRSLRLRGMRGMGFPPQMRMDPSQPIDQRQMFKAAVESYWQNSGGNPN